MEYGFVQKTRFASWFQNSIASALLLRDTDSREMELFHVVLLEKTEDIDLLKAALNKHRHYRYMKEIEVKEVNWFDLKSSSALNLLKLNHSPIVPTEEECDEKIGLPLTINAWRFYPGNGDLLEYEIMPYGVRHSAHAINIIVCTEEEMNESIKMERAVWRHLLNSSYYLCAFELTDIPQSVEELEKEIEEAELQLKRECEQISICKR